MRINDVIPLRFIVYKIYFFGTVFKLLYLLRIHLQEKTANKLMIIRLLVVIGLTDNSFSDVGLKNILNFYIHLDSFFPERVETPLDSL